METTSTKKMPKFTGKKKQYFEALMHAREAYLGQMNFHASEALDSTNADKRGVTTHMADLGSDNFRHAMELQLMTEEGSALELVEEAIERLIEGDYGKCVDCGDEIPEARLKVKPYAIYCINCKSIREQNDGMNPHID
ncbi:MAG: TraR/DksA family transcriptional regulator [Lentisphaerae bacterium]|nr:TraR/DksA family transcriptional regulator [Lentisphaerota bacterium]MCP4100302.1 TraR/DksA family transcriptional regulator [Lentisphaerota bacterium]